MIFSPSEVDGRSENPNARSLLFDLVAACGSSKTSLHFPLVFMLPGYQGISYLLWNLQARQCAFHSKKVWPLGPFKELPKLEDVEARPVFPWRNTGNTYPRFNLINLYLTWFPRTRDFMLILVYQVCCFWWRGSESDPSGERSWKLGRIGRPDI